MLYETRFLLALVITWAIEVPVLFVLINFFFREKTPSPARILGTGLLCSALSLPYLWFVLPPYVDAVHYLVIGEVLAISIETVVLDRVLGLDLKQSFACSVLMNAASVLPGLYLL
jgi:hypothetical protein